MPPHEKLETEVTVMQLIAMRTTIPIPKLHAYSLAREKGPHGIASFMILQYVEGQTLNNIAFKTITNKQWQNLYGQLADIYIQLRRLEFPAIGRLAPSPSGPQVRRKPISNDVNMQHIEGLQPTRVPDYDGAAPNAITSANQYISMLLHLARNAFEKGRRNVFSEADGNDSLYHLDQFSGFVETRWLNPAYDSGPFVLAHGDLEMHNLMVNDKLDIIAVLDWEWSNVVPLQLFSPPTWISNRPIPTLSWDYFYDDYVKRLDKFRSVIRDRELKLYGVELLSKDWATVHEDAGVLIGAALDNWTDIDYVAGRYLDRFLYRRKDLNTRIDRFLKDDPSRRALVAKKVADYKAYRAERKSLGVDDSEDDEQERGEADNAAKEGGEMNKAHQEENPSKERDNVSKSIG